MSILGNRVLRKEDPRFLTVGGTYVADLDDARLDGAVHVTFVRSTIAHAPHRGRRRRRRPGHARRRRRLHRRRRRPRADRRRLSHDRPTMARPLLASDRVRFVGEPVAVVVTETAAEGPDAAELVCGRLRAAAGGRRPRARRSAGDTVLFPEAGTNVGAASSARPRGDAASTAARSSSASGSSTSGWPPCPLEVRAAAAAWDDGRLDACGARPRAPTACATRWPRPTGSTEAEVRVIAPDVGGGFGAKIGASPEELLLPWLARRVGRPVRWVETRTENMVAMGHGRARSRTSPIGGARDGTHRGLPPGRCSRTPAPTRRSGAVLPCSPG